MTAVAPAPASAAEARVEETAPVASQFVQYLFLKVDAEWRRLDAATQARGRAEFEQVVAEAAPGITTHAYSTLGLKADAQLMLWWKSTNAVTVQDTLGALLATGLGRYCEIAHSLWGLTRPSIYTKRRTTQEQAVDETTRLPVPDRLPVLEDDRVVPDEPRCATGHDERAHAHRPRLR